MTDEKVPQRVESNTPLPRKRIMLRDLNKVSEKKLLSVEFGESVLELEYNRSKYTPKFEREIKELMDANLPGNMLSKMLFSLITDWNAEDDVQTDENLALPEDQRETYKIPLTQDTFDALLSIEAMATIVERLSEDNRPNPKSSDFTSDT